MTLITQAFIKCVGKKRYIDIIYIIYHRCGRICIPQWALRNT